LVFSCIYHEQLVIGMNNKISEIGLSIDRKDLQKIIEDPNMPRAVKKEITKIFGMNIW
jgi:hypothetical protein